jgi:hypothetical protein
LHTSWFGNYSGLCICWLIVYCKSATSCIRGSTDKVQICTGRKHHEYNTDVVCPANTLFTLELDMRQRTLHYFVNDSIISRITNIPRGLYFGVFLF